MDGRQITRLLDDAFSSWLASHEAQRVYRALQDVCEVLGRFASLHEAVAFLRDSANGDYQTKDALLRAFLKVYQADGAPDRLALLLLGALRPGLSHVFHQHAGRWPRLEDAELWGQITVSFLEVAASYNLARRPHRVAAQRLVSRSWGGHRSERMVALLLECHAVPLREVRREAAVEKPRI